MKPFLASRVSRFLVGAVLAALLVPQIARADSSARGKFTLASPARWGRLNLPAGTYVYEIGSGDSASFIFVYDLSGRSLGVVMPISTSSTSGADVTRLQVNFENGEGYISSMIVGEMGLEFHFGVPDAKAPLSAKTGRSPQMVAYSAAR